MFGIAFERLFVALLEFTQVGKSCYRYFLTRLDNNEPTIASLEQTVEDIKAVLAASNVPISEGLATRASVSRPTGSAAAKITASTRSIHSRQRSSGGRSASSRSRRTSSSDVDLRPRRRLVASQR